MDTTIKSLEAELKLLRWHKLANESALKAAILKDKQTKRNDGVPQLLYGSKSLHLNSVIEDERSRDLIVDDAFVRKQEEYERKNEEAARKSLLLQTKRLRSIQKKADNIQMLRSRKQKCLQIKADPTRGDECADEEEKIIEPVQCTTAGQPLSPKMLANEQHNQPHCHEHEILMRSRSLPAAMKSHLQTPNRVLGGQTRLHFTKQQSKSGPGEPSRPYYCVRVSQIESDLHGAEYVQSKMFQK